MSCRRKNFREWLCDYARRGYPPVPPPVSWDHRNNRAFWKAWKEIQDACCAGAPEPELRCLYEELVRHQYDPKVEWRGE